MPRILMTTQQAQQTRTTANQPRILKSANKNIFPKAETPVAKPGDIKLNPDNTYTYTNKDGSLHRGNQGDNYVDQTKAPEKGFFQQIGENLKNTGKQFVQDVKNVAGNVKENIGQGVAGNFAAAERGLIGGGLAVLGAAGDVVGKNIFDPAIEGITAVDKAIVNSKPVKELVKTLPPVQLFNSLPENVKSKTKEGFNQLADKAKEGVGILIEKGKEKYDSWAKDNPELAQDARNTVNALNLLGVEEMATGGAELIEQGVKEILPKAITEGFEKKAAEKVAEKSTGLAERIVQKETDKAKLAEEVLTSIKTDGVKTYKDLSNVIENENKAVKLAKDEVLKSNTELYKPEKLVKDGFNYVDESIKNLAEYYKGAKDIPNFNRVMQLYQKSQTQGLTALELDKIAREYGTEFGTNAFSKVTGEPLTSVSAQAFENVRSGVKDTTRSLFEGNKSLQTLDERVSKLINAKKMVDDVAIKVGKLEAKLKNENALMKLGRKVGSVAGKIIDVGTGGTVRGFISKFFPSNMGYKTMNYLDIEAELGKNLKLLDKLNNSKGQEFINNLEELVKTGAEAEKKKGTLMLPEAKPGAIKAEVKTPIELPAKTISSSEKSEISNIQNQQLGKKIEASAKPQETQKLLPKGESKVSIKPIELPAQGKTGIKPLETTSTRFQRIKQSVKDIKDNQKGFARLPGGKTAEILKNIDVNDKKIMTDFIDYARLGKAEDVDLEIKARSMAEAMGINAEKDNKKLANSFDQILSSKK